MMLEARAAGLGRAATRLPHRLPVGEPRADLPARRDRRDRLRGPAVPVPRRLRFQLHPRGGARQRARQATARREHHLAAGRQEPVPVVRPQLRAQGPGGLLHRADRDAVAQGAHPGDVPEHRAVRRRHLRGAGRRAALLAQVRRCNLSSARGGVAGGRAAEPGAVAGRPALALRAEAARLDPRRRCAAWAVPRTCGRWRAERRVAR